MNDFIFHPHFKNITQLTALSASSSPTWEINSTTLQIIYHGALLRDPGSVVHLVWFLNVSGCCVVPWGLRWIMLRGHLGMPIIPYKGFAQRECSCGLRA